jgi:hypothetical protein
VIAHVGRVMTSGAGALERADGHGAESGIVVEAANVGDGERTRIEERLAGSDFFAGCDAVVLEWIVRGLQIRPRLEHGERGGTECAAVRIFAERIVGPWIVGLLRKVVGAALRAVCDEQAGSKIGELGAEKTEFEIHDFLLLLYGGRLRSLRVSVGGVDGLLHQVGGEIGHEGGFAVQWIGDGFAAVEHHGAQKAEIRGGQRAAVDGNGLLAGGGIGDDGAAVGVANSFDGELRGARNFEEDANHAVLEEQAVVGGIAGGAGGAVRAVDGGEQRVFAVREGEAGADVLDAEAHGVAGLVAGAAGAAVGTKALEEWTVFADRAIGVVSGDDASGIEEREKIRNHGGGKSAGERKKYGNYKPLSRADFCGKLQDRTGIHRAPLIE